MTGFETRALSFHAHQLVTLWIDADRRGHTGLRICSELLDEVTSGARNPAVSCAAAAVLSHKDCRALAIGAAERSRLLVWHLTTRLWPIRTRPANDNFAYGDDGRAGGTPSLTARRLFPSLGGLYKQEVSINKTITRISIGLALWTAVGGRVRPEIGATDPPDTPVPDPEPAPEHSCPMGGLAFFR